MAILGRFPAGGTHIKGAIEKYTVQAGETISAGDFVQYVLSAGVNTEVTASEGVSYFDAVAISDTKVLLLYGKSKILSVILTISGKTISASSVVAMRGSISGSLKGLCAIKLPDDKVRVIYSTYDVSNGVTLRSFQVSIDGLARTASDDIVLLSYDSGSIEQNLQAFLLDDGGYCMTSTRKSETKSGVSLCCTVVDITNDIATVRGNLNLYDTDSISVENARSQHHSCLVAGDTIFSAFHVSSPSKDAGVWGVVFKTTKTGILNGEIKRIQLDNYSSSNVCVCESSGRVLVCYSKGTETVSDNESKGHMAYVAVNGDDFNVLWADKRVDGWVSNRNAFGIAKITNNKAVITTSLHDYETNYSRNPYARLISLGEKGIAMSGFIKTPITAYSGASKPVALSKSKVVILAPFNIDNESTRIGAAILDAEITLAFDSIMGVAKNNSDKNGNINIYELL